MEYVGRGANGLREFLKWNPDKKEGVFGKVQSSSIRLTVTVGGNVFMLRCGHGPGWGKQRIARECGHRRKGLRSFNPGTGTPASGGAAATISTWMLPKGFERKTIGTIGTIGTLGAVFLSGYLLVTGSRLRNGETQKTAATSGTTATICASKSKEQQLPKVEKEK